MYSPNKSGEYTPCGDVPNFTVQGLRDALTKAESTVTEPPPLTEEFVIQLDVTMGDRPGRPRPPAYSWNGGLVRHALKNDPAVGDLKHVEVDGPRRAYLFFYDRQGYRGLPKDEALAMRSHIADAFAEWIGRSTHFETVPLLLEVGRQRAMATQERCRQRVRPLEEPVLPVFWILTTRGWNTHATRSSGRSDRIRNAPYECGKATLMPSQNQTSSGRRRRGRRWISTFLSRTARRSRL